MIERISQFKKDSDHAEPSNNAPTIMRDIITVQIIHNTFQNALNGQKISNGGNAIHKSSSAPLFQFVDWILDLLDGGQRSNVAEKDIAAAKCMLLVDGYNMVHQLLNAATDVDGNLVGECRFKIGHGFTLTQQYGQLVLRDEKNSEVIAELTGVSFNQLKSKILQAYIKETGDHLSDFDGDHHFQGVDFRDVRMTSNDLETLVRCRADLTDAILIKSDGEEASASDFNKSIKKTLALQSIKAGADPQAALTHYLITQREMNEQLFMSSDSESIEPIDIGGFDVTGLNLNDMAYTDTNPEGLLLLHVQCRDVNIIIEKVAEINLP